MKADLRISIKPERAEGRKKLNREKRELHEMFLFRKGKRSERKN
jgi:hypothetical protein